MNIGIEQNETIKEYKLRLCRNKEIYDLSWTTIATLINNASGFNYDESVYRKWFRAYDEGVQDSIESFARHNNSLEQLKEEKIEIAKQKVIVRDERVLVNEKIREISRSEHLKDIAKSMATEFGKKLPMCSNTAYENKIFANKKSAILTISDWHFGLEIDNFLNIYNHDVFLCRINQLTDRVLKEIVENNIEKLYVVNLNDLISGLIRQNIRLQNRENIIEQITIVSETLSEMLFTFSEYVPVEYHSVLDNHSRMVSNKSEHLSPENFSILIDWFLKERLKNSRITMPDNTFDKDICVFEVYGWNYAGVHGDKDKIHNVVQNISLMTRQFYDVVFTAHMHHFSAEEIHSTYIVSNGSLCGTDQYAKDIRRTSNPSQNLIIVSEEDCLEKICPLKLN